MTFGWHWLETMISAGTGTAFGAGLTWFATRSERESSRKHDERRVRRDKAELVFVEIAKMQRNASEGMLWAAQTRAGLNATRPDGYDPAPLEALVSLYFPEGVAVLERRANANSQAVIKQMGSIADASKTSDAKKVQEAHIIIALEGNQAAATAATELREVVRASVDPLTTR